MPRPVKPETIPHIMPTDPIQPAPTPTPTPTPDTTTTSTTTETSSSPPSTTTVTTTAIKPGWKTTEFYFNIVANVVSALLITDVLAPGSSAAKIVGVIALVLSNLGYTVIRTNAKKAPAQSGFAALELLVALMLAGVIAACVLLAACGTLAGAGKDLKTDAIDCTTQQVRSLAKQFAPTLEQVLSRATGNDGRVDMPSLETATAALEADGWCVLENTVARVLARGVLPGAPQSSPQDLAALREGVAELRAKKFGARSFKVDAQ